MKVSVLKINPSLASTMLLDNSNNRTISKAMVLNLSAQMKSGEWKLNGESIKFNKLGRLLDGQHRLSAIVHSGVTVELLVLHEFENDVFATLDTGKRRGGGDVLSIENVKNPNIVAGAIKLIIAYKNELTLNTSGAMSRYASNQKTIEFERENNLSDLSNQSMQWYLKNKIITPTQFLFLYFILRGIDKQDAHDFLEKLSGGANLGDKNPIKVLRDRILKYRNSTLKLPQSQLIYMIFKAWNYYRDGKEITKIPLYKEDDKPIVLR